MADRRGALLVLAVVFAVGLGVWFGRGQGALAPGPVAVEAGAAAGAPDDVARGVGAEVGKVGDEAVRQSAQARVFGHVYDHTGRALGGVPVVLQRHGTQPTKPKFRRALDPLPREEKGQVPYLPHATKSDAAGAFAFEAVEPAAYRVAAGTGRATAEEVVVDPSEQQEVDLRFPADTVQLVGRATRGGRFASDLSVEVRTGPVPTPLAMEADGSFQSFFAAGPCTVRLRQHRLGKGSGAALVVLVERQLVLARGQGVVRCDFDVPATSLHARLAVVGGRLDGVAEFVAAGRTPDGDTLELLARGRRRHREVRQPAVRSVDGERARAIVGARRAAAGRRRAGAADRGGRAGGARGRHRAGARPRCVRRGDRGGRRRTAAGDPTG